MKWRHCIALSGLSLELIIFAAWPHLDRLSLAFGLMMLMSGLIIGVIIGAWRVDVLVKRGVWKEGGLDSSVDSAEKSKKEGSHANP